MCQIKAGQFRRLAAECERQAELAAGEPLFREMQARLAKSYFALAEAEDWLDGFLADTVNAPAEQNLSMEQAA